MDNNRDAVAFQKDSKGGQIRSGSCLACLQFLEHELGAGADEGSERSARNVIRPQFEIELFFN